MRIISFIIYIYVKIQLTNHKDISNKDLNALKTYNKIGLWLFLPDILLYIISRGSISSFLLQGGTAWSFILIMFSIIIFALNINNKKTLNFISKTDEVIVNDNNIIETNNSTTENKKNEANTSYDLYALVISIVTLPTLLFIYLTNVTEKEIIHPGAWATTSTVYSISDSIKAVIILLSVASAVISMYLILHKGKNNSMKATWVKILNVINIIGEIIILSI